jgi:hypothetical protein
MDWTIWWRASMVSIAADRQSSTTFIGRPGQCFRTAPRFAAHHLPFYEKLHAQRLDISGV